MQDKIYLVHKDTLSCEPIVRRMKNGELLLICQCGDVKEPAPDNRVYVFHSQDNGVTWSKPELLIPEDGRTVYLTEVMVLDDVVTVFVTTHNGSFLNWKVELVVSRDCGYHWASEGAPEYFPTFTFYRGMIRLQNGNIVIPYHHYPVSEEENARLFAANLSWREAQISAVQNGVIISEDGGKTYTLHEGPELSFAEEGNGRWVWSETTVVETEPNHLVMLMRTNLGRLYRTDSLDGGHTWCKAQPTDIPNPCNKPKLIALENGHIALIHTPNSQIGMDHRNPLSIWFSKDGLNTFYRKHIVTEFPGSFCYPDGFYEHGHILFSIEYNRHDIFLFDHEVEF